MHPSCESFVWSALKAEDLEGKRVLEVGSQDVNGSVRRHLESYRPASYLGVDIVEGPGVDQVCPADRLVDTFGSDAFDVVLTTEVLEHVKDWRTAIHNLKAILRPGGILVITTRSPGFAVHAYPVDCWRYTVGDMRRIFADFEIDQLEKDLPADPGVFVRVRRPARWSENDLSSYKLYSIARRSRAMDFTKQDERIVRYTTHAQMLLPMDVTYVLRFAGNLLGRFSADRRSADADLTSNMHRPF